MVWVRALGLVGVTFFAACSLDDVVRPAAGGPPPLACTPLAPGVSQAVSADQGPTHLPLRYLLTREQDVAGHAAYSATIPVEFRSADNAAPSPSAPAMLARANQCLDAVAPYLTGPAGETLALRLAPPRPGEMGPYQIALSHDGSFKHSRNWDPNWACPAIVHEVMHLVGLVDEDRELRLGGRYDCRALGPEDSLMTQPLTAFAAATALAECTCDDAQNSLGCRQGMVGAPETAVAVPRCPARRASLLYPAEFRAIVSPACTERNATFYACAANAYRTSTAEGCVSELPAECRGGALDWILK